MRYAKAGKLTLVALAAGGAMLVVPLHAGATSASNDLRLSGGDTLVSDAWHCSTYVKSCSWRTAAKLKGNTPRRARWIQMNSEVQGHGISPKITIGKNTNVEITFRSKSLVKTRWRNRQHWISWSGGKVSPSFSTAYVSTRSSASAYHKVFGRPSGLVAYAGAF